MWKPQWLNFTLWCEYELRNKHLLLLCLEFSLYLSELRPGDCYPALDESLDGSPSEICWGEAAEYDKGLRSALSRKGWKTWRNRSKWARYSFYFIDEQENTIPVVCADKWVAGGGVIHTVSKVRCPSQVLPKTILIQEVQAPAAQTGLVLDGSGRTSPMLDSQGDVGLLLI
jgi:hypothetical protein